jgi:hypothetical protein
MMMPEKEVSPSIEYKMEPLDRSKAAADASINQIFYEQQSSMKYRIFLLTFG